MAILLEHYSGKLPFWLSPRQINICPISEKSHIYSEEIFKRLKIDGFEVELNKSSNTVNKKIREAEVNRYNYILVIGEKESHNSTINLRSKNNINGIEIKYEDLVEFLNKLVNGKMDSEKGDILEKEYFEGRECKDMELYLNELEIKLQYKFFLADDINSLENKNAINTLNNASSDITIDKYPNIYKWKLLMLKLK